MHGRVGIEKIPRKKEKETSGIQQWFNKKKSGKEGIQIRARKKYLLRSKGPG